MTEHDFAASLDLSHRYADAPWWPQVYEAAFGPVVMADLRNDGIHQRQGIDRALTLQNSKQILVDEKVRAADYGDFLLERWSDVDARKPGWVQDWQIRADYIAYAVVPISTCWLWPVLQLQCAWLRFGRDWVASAARRERGFRLVEAKNRRGSRSWTTESVCLPRDVLMQALGDAFRVEFDSESGVAA